MYIAQSDRFFNALKGHGTLCRLVILPYESHGYAARESIRHVLWETNKWLQKHCVPNTTDGTADLDTCKDGATKEAADSEGKASVPSGGGSPELDQSNQKPRSLMW
ncbi:hypothetical protein SLEP1_g1469 [Rubroshorea leprosula]|uniref:Uncharacterized protein n=1 Tax=Rubroshorea leprosula TaxID=152421 RepID=A0AAV5HDV9_9ROSI|nr:hypothetical protein SLEP1_g1469 [Rubroshorea leprosula]